MAGQSHVPQASTALNQLCRTYWYPLYAYVRRYGYAAHDAQDLTQEFFARFLEKKYFHLASPERGRFRSFLLKSLKHFLINEWQRGQAQRRGSGKKVISLDEEAAELSYAQDATGTLPAESLYDRRWAMTLLERAMERLSCEYGAAGKQALFDKLKPLLLAEGSGESYRQIAVTIGLTEGAVKVALHRLRQRFGEAVRVEIARTVATPEEVDAELQCLMTALNG